MTREQMNIVVVGHVDHGKSTVIGRLMADTGSLPKGKLEQVKAMCAKNARPFEYAFLLDALKDEQAQGITIDAARCFFKSASRDYIIIDAPGHIEFLKNMITGAARAEAALLVIDADEGVQENSRRHGYMLSLLGIKQVVVLVNKMDLVNYDQQVFRKIEEEYLAFLKKINIVPQAIIPISGMEGVGIVNSAGKIPWYTGQSTLVHLDQFVKEKSTKEQPLRLPVQDIYKFTEENDNRRIVAGSIETGQVKPGDELIFLPSQKKSTVSTIELFNAPTQASALAGQATGLTLSEQIYITRGELAVKANEPQPHMGTRFKASIFWMSKAPMIMNKRYKLKLAAARTSVKLVAVNQVLDASDLTTVNNKKQIDRYDVAECILETYKPVAFDLSSELAATGRFVIVDNYALAGGGIINQPDDSGQSSLDDHIAEREKKWDISSIRGCDRAAKFHHLSKFVVINGPKDIGKRAIAKALEAQLFEIDHLAYYLGMASLKSGLESEVTNKIDDREDHLRHLGELARIMTDAGQIFITVLDDGDEYELSLLKKLNEPNDIVVIQIGDHQFVEFKPSLELPIGLELNSSMAQIIELMRNENIVTDYCI